jgi:hypothetical protein
MQGRDVNENTTTALTRGERSDLRAAEEIIEQGIGTFIEVGEALLEIRNRRLYRDSHDTFEAYCRERWGFSDSRARQLVGAAETVTTVTVENLPAPSSERVARELASLPEPEQREAWSEAVEQNGRPTAAQVREIVKRRRGRKRAGAKSNSERKPKASRTIIPTEVRELHSGMGRNGRPYALYEVAATDADGQVIEERLRSFAPLPVGRPVQVDVEVEEGERGVTYKVTRNPRIAREIDSYEKKRRKTVRLLVNEVGWGRSYVARAMGLRADVVNADLRDSEDAEPA